MPTIDSCINGIFVPGQIPGSPGTTPGVPTVGTLIDPDNYDPNSLTYSLDYSKFYNSPYIGVG